MITEESLKSLKRFKGLKSLKRLKGLKSLKSLISLKRLIPYLRYLTKKGIKCSNATCRKKESTSFLKRATLRNPFKHLKHLEYEKHLEHEKHLEQLEQLKNVKHLNNLEKLINYLVDLVDLDDLVDLFDLDDLDDLVDLEKKEKKEMISSFFNKRMLTYQQNVQENKELQNVQENKELFEEFINKENKKLFSSRLFILYNVIPSYYEFFDINNITDLNKIYYDFFTNKFKNDKPIDTEEIPNIFSYYDTLWKIILNNWKLYKIKNQSHSPIH